MPNREVEMTILQELQFCFVAALEPKTTAYASEKGIGIEQGVCRLTLCHLYKGEFKRTLHLVFAHRIPGQLVFSVIPIEYKNSLAACQ